MKKIYIFLVVVLMPLAINAEEIVCHFIPTLNRGNGTEGNPFLLSSPTDLRTLMIDVNNGFSFEGQYFKLENDIDFEGETYGISIGSQVVEAYGYSYNIFKGVFDGNGKRLKNYTNRSAEFPDRYKGFFYYIENAVVKNLIIDESCSFEEGSFISHASTSTISGCINYASMHHTSSANSSNLISYSVNCTISDCVNHAQLRGSIVGLAESCTISKCVNYGTINDGIVSRCERTDISDCINYGEPKGETVGGIVGQMTAGSVTNCINHGNINQGTICVGGIVGYNGGANISNCENRGNLNVFGYTGGIVGNFGQGALSNYENGTTEYFSGNIENCNNYGSVKGSKCAGGIAGYFSGPLVKDCNNYASVEAKDSYKEVVTFDRGAAGGIVGIVSDCGIIDCTNEGAVICNANTGGGIVGCIYKTNTDYKDNRTIRSSIIDCYNSGTVMGTFDEDALLHVKEQCVGGIVGQSSYVFEGVTSPPYIYNCINSGHVTGVVNVGGISGGGSNFDMKYNLSTGNVTAIANEGKTVAGALVGGDFYDNTVVMSNNFYENNVVVKSGDVEYSGAMSRAIAGNRDIDDNNGALLPNIEIEANPQGDEYWTTFYRKYGTYEADEYTEVYTAQLVTSSNTKKFVLTEVPNRIIKGGSNKNGVILRSSRDVILLTLTKEVPDEEVYSQNVLSGCDFPENAYPSYYVLTTGEAFGFMKCSENQLPANQAFFKADFSGTDIVPIELNGQLLFQPILGDLNGDKQVNQEDLHLMDNAIVTGSNNNINEVAADLNGDTKINVADIVLLINKINGQALLGETAFYLIGDHNGWDMTDKTYAFTKLADGKTWEITIPSEGAGCFKIAPESAYDHQDGTFWSYLLCAEYDQHTGLHGIMQQGDIMAAWLLNTEGATSYTIRIVPSEMTYKIIPN